jgi:thymidylate synthase ThyX
MTSDIFCLVDETGNLLNPAVQATVLAKYSRSPDSVKDLYGNITEEEAHKFHDKWVISYGHSSVAELAVIPICFEGVSMVASKFIESFQRAGYSEKSTRYQVFNSSSFVTPPGLPSSMKEFANRFFEAYERMLPEAEKISLEKWNLPDTAANRRLPKVKARAFDMLRGLLPAGTGTNLAAVMNLRDVRYLVQQARASNNPEIREIGEKVFTAASKITPTLIKEALPDHFEPKIKTLGRMDLELDSKAGVRVIDFDANGSERLKRAVTDFYGMDWDYFRSHMETRANQAVPSIFKIPRITYQITMDYGSYRDLQRHRRCEQYTEPLTPFLGYDVPDDIVGSDLEASYRRVMDGASLYDGVVDPEMYQYVVPMGYLHRSVFAMDLREVYYITELRTKPQGHISYRRIAYDMYRKACEVYPELMIWCKAIEPDAIGAHN